MYDYYKNIWKYCENIKTIETANFTYIQNILDNAQESVRKEWEKKCKQY